MPDVPACFPTSQELHKKEVNYFSYEIHVDNANILEIKPSTDGQPPTKVYVEKLEFKDPEQMKQLLENMKKDIMTGLIQHFNTQECGVFTKDGGENPIEMDPSSSGSIRPEVIEKDKLIEKVKESTGKKYALGPDHVS